jgi:hypothetical protein
MSKYDLEKEWKNILSKTSDHRDKVDIYQHIYPVNLDDVLLEVQKALKKLFPVNYSKYDDVVDKHCKIYVEELYNRFISLSRSSSVKVVKYRVEGSYTNFIVICTSTQGRNSKTSIFARINDVRTKKTSGVSGLKSSLKSSDTMDLNSDTSPLGRLRAGILLDIFNIDITDASFDSSVDSRTLDVVMGSRYKDKYTGERTGIRHGGLLQLGHLEGFTVVQKKASEISKSIKRKFKIDVGEVIVSKAVSQKRDKLEGIIGKFGIRIKVNMDKLVLGSDEFSLDNQFKEEENSIIKELKEEFFSKAENMVDTRGSSTIREIASESGQIVVQTAIDTAFSKVKGYKKGVKNPKKTDRKPSTTAPLKIQTLATLEKSTGNSKIQANSKKSSTSSKRETKKQPNWYSLVGIINAKLPQQVANNMGAPGLVYRTGRFANSTKVINVETTKDGYPTVVFDYQRDPYDVFDRTKGASPWNTPARDPRALVDRSVREIVQEMAIGRFYTRRA